MRSALTQHSHMDVGSGEIFAAKHPSDSDAGVKRDVLGTGERRIAGELAWR